MSVPAMSPPLGADTGFHFQPFSDTQNDLVNRLGADAELLSDFNPAVSFREQLGYCALSSGEGCEHQLPVAVAVVVVGCKAIVTERDTS